MKRTHHCALLMALAALLPLPTHAKGTITGKVQSSELREASGIAASRVNPGVVWLHNDGQTNRLFGVRTTGETVAVLEWPNAMVDFEDIASGPGPTADEAYLYIGDIGDNEARRPQVRVYRAVGTEDHRFERAPVPHRSNGRLPLYLS